MISFDLEADFNVLAWYLVALVSHPEVFFLCDPSFSWWTLVEACQERIEPGTCRFGRS